MLMKRKPFLLTWSPAFAYAIGLIASDGNLSSDGRHIAFTSKDRDLVQVFINCLGLKNKIGYKFRGELPRNKCFQVQFGSKVFYEFLTSIGIFPRKSRTIAKLLVPEKFFQDFLRGCIDGDGCIDVYKHPESRHPQLRIRLVSASPLFLSWIHGFIAEQLAVMGGSVYQGRRACYLQYNKADSLKILRYIYYRDVSSYLKRKYKIALPFLQV